MEGRAQYERLMESEAVVPDNVVYRSFEAETLLLNLSTGNYHGIDAPGGRFLEVLSETHGDIARSVLRLAAEYDVDVEELAQDLTAFCAELVDRGLLELTAK